MRRTLVFAKHELTDFFTTPIPLAALVVFLFGCGVWTTKGAGWFTAGQADLSLFFTAFVWGLPFLIPALTVRLWTDERAEETLEMLLHLPLTPWQAVLGKWLASCIVGMVALIGTLPFWGVVNSLGEPDNLVIAGSYGLAALLIGVECAAGLLMAALGRRLIVSWVLATAFLLALTVLGWTPFLDGLPDGLARFIAHFSPYFHFEPAILGLVRVVDLSYFILAPALLLSATWVVVDLRLPPPSPVGRQRPQTPEAKRRRRLQALAAITFMVLLVGGLVVRTSSGARLDLTEESRHTLSPHTLQVLTGLTNIITIRLYRTSGGEGLAGDGAAYYDEVRRKMENFRAVSGDRVRTEYYDPQPDTESAKHAEAFGLWPMSVEGSGDIHYFGLVASNSNDGLEIIPAFDKARQGFLEHDLARLVDALNNTTRKVVGVISTLPIKPDTLAQAENNRLRTWAVVDLIRKSYTLRELPTEVPEIPSDVDVLMLVHPHDLPISTLYAIDQFALKGGRVLAFVDPNAEVDRKLPGGVGQATSSDFNRLLETWGVVLDPYRVLADRDAARSVLVVGVMGPEVVANPVSVSFTRKNFAPLSPVMGDMERIMMASPGVLLPVASRSTEVLPLITSSANAMRIESRRADATPPDIKGLLAGFVSENQSFLTMAAIQGPARTAFKDGLRGEGNQGHVETSLKGVNIIVAADVDMLHDDAWFMPDPQSGTGLAEPLRSTGRSVVMMSDNSRFITRALSYLTASDGVTAIRETIAHSRPFSTLLEIKSRSAPPLMGKEHLLLKEISRLEEEQTKLENLRREVGGPGQSGEEKEALKLIPEKIAELRLQIAGLPEVKSREELIAREIGAILFWRHFWVSVFAPMALLIGAGLLVQRHRARG